jgi:hypothetical protein
VHIVNIIRRKIAKIIFANCKTIDRKYSGHMEEEGPVLSACPAYQLAFLYLLLHIVYLPIHSPGNLRALHRNKSFPNLPDYFPKQLQKLNKIPEFHIHKTYYCAARNLHSE